MKKLALAVAYCWLSIVQWHPVSAQQVMQTGGQKMPDEWIDKDTRHKVVKLTRNDGSNLSFYFHNSPFIGNKMVYYSSGRNDVSGIQKQETYSTNARNKQLHLLDLSTLKSEQLTYHSSPMNGEIVHRKSGEVYYQIKDSVYSVNAHTKKVKLVYVFPADFKGNITTVNADGSLLAGAW
jgi:oligogalacturonide lyase